MLIFIIIVTYIKYKYYIVYLINIQGNIIKNKLKDITLFSELDEQTINKIECFTYESKLVKDSILFFEGDESKYLYILVSGIIKLYKTSSTNKKIILKYFHTQELIAEVANFEHIPYPATACAFTDIEYLKIDFEKLKEYIYSNPDLFFKIQLSLIKKIKNLEHVISFDLVLDSKQRVAKYIFENENEFFTQKNIEIAEILNITLGNILSDLSIMQNGGMVGIKPPVILEKNENITKENNSKILVSKLTYNNNDIILGYFI